MSDQLLGVFKICLLALLYLFFARVLWAVWSEVRPSTKPVIDHRAMTPDPTAPGGAPAPGTMLPPPSGAPSTRARRAPKPPKTPKGRVGRLMIIEPRARKGGVIGLTAEVTVGRAPGCTVSITDDTFVSQLHARIFNQDDDVYVEDLGSTNGTFVNGQRLTRVVALHRGDRVQIGATVLEAE